MVYENSFEQIVTFEGYYKSYLLNKEAMVIPYVNIGISNHPLNPSNQLKHLNFGYIIYFDIALVKYNNTIIFDNTELKYGSYTFYYSGGINLDLHAGTEFQILAKKARLQTTDKMQLSDSFWVPYDTTAQKSNMSNSDVDHFFDPNSFRNVLK
ncbi:hypothetical protein [Chryseosolibacter indicus]|uniref:Uncharacterized protein n=1 Tax=Chryseosolibacter indicus TaxID=2782351 RepID=A0ABS5VY05_9BACT|nr:hypothetical protein [Chryseosolibacter indicus]MBT1705809.1 hypothetical protein [Chryseosolibacter indicus]